MTAKTSLCVAVCGTSIMCIVPHAQLRCMCTSHQLLHCWTCCHYYRFPVWCAFVPRCSAVLWYGAAVRTWANCWAIHWPSASTWTACMTIMASYCWLHQHLYLFTHISLLWLCAVFPYVDWHLLLEFMQNLVRRIQKTFGYSVAKPTHCYDSYSVSA